jgi:hypothetical protein
MLSGDPSSTGVLTGPSRVSGLRTTRPDRCKHRPGEKVFEADGEQRGATVRVVKGQALQTGTENMSDVAERVKKIVTEHLGVEPEKVVTNANFIDDLGADSLDTVELVMAF